MFSDSQAKEFVGKKWRIILPVTKFFTDDFFYRWNFLSTFFLPIQTFHKSLTLFNFVNWSQNTYRQILTYWGNVTYLASPYTCNMTQCVRSVRIRSLSGSYFPAFGVNTERILRHFSRSEWMWTQIHQLL